VRDGGGGWEDGEKGQEGGAEHDPPRSQHVARAGADGAHVFWGGWVAITTSLLQKKASYRFTQYAITVVKSPSWTERALWPRRVVLWSPIEFIWLCVQFVK